jgi:hypothetical protein
MLRRPHPLGLCRGAVPSPAWRVLSSPARAVPGGGLRLRHAPGPPPPLLRAPQPAASAAPDPGDEGSTFPALLAGLAIALDAASPGDGGSAARAFAAANPAVTSLEFVAWLADA